MIDAVTELDGPVWVVSPHLDDAVLSCGRLLAALQSPVVFTVFGGSPRGADIAAHEWDVGTTGHDKAVDAVAVRQAEDLTATALVGAQPVWTEWSQYHDPQPGAHELEAALAPLADGVDGEGDGAPRTVLVPLGVMHPDHVAVSDAARRHLLGGRGGPGPGRYVYADVPYQTAYPALVVKRLECWRRDVSLTEVRLPQAQVERRLAAVDAYVTQMPMLRALLPHIDDDLRGTERYWRMGLLPAD